MVPKIYRTLEINHQNIGGFFFFFLVFFKEIC